MAAACKTIWDYVPITSVFLSVVGQNVTKDPPCGYAVTNFWAGVLVLEGGPVPSKYEPCTGVRGGDVCGSPGLVRM